MGKIRNSAFCKLLLILGYYFPILLLSGCGSSTKDSGFPEQIRITPTQGIVEGRIVLPDLVSDTNLNTSIQRAVPAKSIDSRILMVRRTLTPVTNFSNFNISGIYKDSSGILRTVRGSVSSDGAYFIGGVPFGVELEIIVSKGQLELKATIPPLEVSNPQMSKTVNVDSTAETLLYSKLKEELNQLTISSALEFQNFEAEKLLLAELIANELKNENVDALSGSILSRPIVTDNVTRAADLVDGSSLTGDHLPYAVIDLVEQIQRGRVELTYRLFDAESDQADVNLLYSLDGQNFQIAAVGSGGSGLFNLKTSRSGGESHSISWESAADLGVGLQHRVILAIDTFPSGKPQSDEFRTRSQTTMIDVDNRGLPEISSLSSNTHQIGSTSALTIIGKNLSTVRQISLQYLGNEVFIDPDELGLNSFQLVDDQRIDTVLPEYGYFPVDYRLVLTGSSAGENSISTQIISVYEVFGPDFTGVSVNLTPSTTVNDSGAFISFQGYHLTGSYSNRVRIKKTTNSSVSYLLEPVSAKLQNDLGQIKWTGRIPSPVETGIYDILVRNTCNPLTPCGNEIILPQKITLTESLAVISNVNLPSSPAFNSQSNQIDVIGKRLTSVDQVRVSTNRASLITDFTTSNNLSLNTISTTYEKVEAIFPEGGVPGTYFVGVRNQAGITVSTATFSIQEGVPTSISVSLETTGGAPLGNQIDNRTDYNLRITGKSLSSLKAVRLINQDLASVIVNLTPTVQTFTQAVVKIPKHNAPGKYNLELENSAGVIPEQCGSECFEITQAAPIITSFKNVTRPLDLATNQMIAGENAVLEIKGENLAGITSGGICATPLDCPYLFQPAISDFDLVVRNLSSADYFKPGSYSIKITHSANGLVQATQTALGNSLEIYERQPIIDSIFPRSLSNRELDDQNNIITFTGRNLYGVDEICLIPFRDNLNGCEVSCSTTAPYYFAGSEIQGIGRNQTSLTIAQNTQIIPGRYVWKVRNYAPPSTDDFSPCSPLQHDMQIVEPPLTFTSFVGTPSTNSVTVVAHTTSQIKVVGEYLYSLDKVEIKRRFDVLNLSSVFELQIETTALSSADLTVPASLIPGVYDLYMKNADMSAPILVGASVQVIEVLTPVITDVNLKGSNQINTEIVYFDIFGNHIAGAALITKDIQLVDVRDNTHVIPILASRIQLSALANQTPYISIGTEIGTVGGEYRISVKNSANLSSSLSNSPIITIYEPRAQFKSVSVIGPFDSVFGFGENNKHTRLEFRGAQLGSTDQIRLTREPGYVGDSMDQLILTTANIFRRFGSTDLTVVSSLPTFLRPGFYDVELRNNSGEFSALIDPVTSPFFEQVQVLEGAPKIDFVGCLDFTGAASTCSSLSTTRNVNSLQDFEFTGQNIFTLKRIDFFREGANSPDYTFNLPEFGKSLAGTGVLTRTSRTVAIDMPQILKYIGYYDIELTNAISTVRFRRKLRSVETFLATISSLTPSQVINNLDKDVLISGDHLTGTTYVGLWDSSYTTEITQFEFSSDSVDPLKFVKVKVHQNVAPGDYRIKVINSKGFNQIGSNSNFVITEPSPSITKLSSMMVTNAQTQIVYLNGDGFLGLQNVVLKPSDSGQAKTSNDNMSLFHSQIPLDYSVTSRSLISVEIPPFQLPGFYDFSMTNTNPVSYRHPQPFEIRERPPTINTFDPDRNFYANSSTLTVYGSDFLGISGTVSSSTHAKLIHIETGTTRELDLESAPSFGILSLTVPKNLLIGLYRLELKNTQGIADSLTTTQFEIREGPIELSNVTTQILQYNADFSNNANRISIYGQHLQGVKKIEIVTTTLGKEYRYKVDHLLGTIDPYVSIENMPIDTGMIYPGKYLLEITNSAGLFQLSTPVIDVRIPESSITDFSPKTGPYNAPTEIVITGTNLRRFEQLIFERNVPGGDADDSINVIQISTNGDPQIFTEVDNNKVRVRLRSQEGKFDDSKNRFFKLKWKTYGDSTVREFAGVDAATSRFTLTDFYPEIDSFETSTAVVLNSTADFSDNVSISANIATTSIDDGLPVNLVVKGSNFVNIRSISLLSFEDSSVKWTLACTDGTGAAALNASNATQLVVTIPRDIFHYPAPGSAPSCGNNANLLPLKPGVYSVILEDGLKISDAANKNSMIYFAEGLPQNLDVVNGNPTSPRYNDADHIIEITGENLGGVRNISVLLSGQLQTSYSIPKSDILSDSKFRFEVLRGSLRGLKNDGLQYSFEVENSRGKSTLGGGLFKLREKPPQITKISPSSGKNITTNPVIIEGNHLFGVGRLLPSIGENSLLLINEESHLNASIQTLSYDISSSVTVQSLTSFIAVVPQNILPGRYFMSVENDSDETANNPKFFSSIIFESLDSAPTVTFVTPLVSDFDLLPTTMIMQGINLIGVRNATLTLISTATANTVALSLFNSPELTSNEFSSARFLLPQSPDFLIPGPYDITLSNLAGDFKLPNFQILIREKVPHIDSIIPNELDNSSISTFTISGDNLFGLPRISANYESTTVSIEISGVVQSRNILGGLTLPDSLFPDIWTISLTNTRGSTSKTIVVTEPIPEISNISPAQVPFNDRTKITLRGDHLLGASTAPGAIILTDELNTPLEDIERIDRYSISAWVPRGVNLGKYEVIASNKRGKNTTSALLTVLGSGLSLDSITPNTGLAVGGQYVVLQGSGFVEGTRVAIADTLAQDIRVTPTSLEAFVPPANPSLDLSQGSTLVNVVISNPDNQKITKVDFFTYLRDSESDPRILDIFPGAISGDGPTDIPIDSRIAIIFDQAMNPATITTELPNSSGFNGIEILSDRNLIGGTVTWNPDHKRHFVYDSLGNAFISNKLVEIGLANSIEAQNGRTIVTTDVVQINSGFFGVAGDQYIEDWSFVAGNSVDSGNLTVVSPLGTGALAPSTWTTVIEFNKPVNPLTLKSDDFELIEDARNHRIPVEVTILSGGKRVLVNPTELLRTNHDYTLTIKNDNLKSLTDLSMGGDFEYKLGSEITGPKLISVTPQNGATDIARNSVIVAQFDQAILIDSVNTSNFYIESTAGVKLEGSFSNTEDQLFFTFDLLDLLNSGETYLVTVNNRIKSITGVALTSGATSAFKVSTNNSVDLAGPVILDVFPANLQSGVSTDVTILVTFSEAINLADVTTANFSLTQTLSESESLALSYSLNLYSDNSAVMMKPHVPLEYSGDYRIFVASGIRDIANNNSVNSVATTFKVTPRFDSIGPGIIDVTPDDGQQNVSINTQITILFSEAINTLDATDSSKISLRTSAGVQVLGSYVQEQEGRLVRIIPQENLQRLTEYIVSVGTDVRDLFGNSRSEISTFSFITEDFNDVLAPQILLLTVNDIPATLNGDGAGLLNNEGNVQLPVIHVPSNGFTIDIYYEDPGTGGETSGVDQNSITIRDQKVIFDSNQSKQLTNLNLMQQGVTPIHMDGHSRLVVPSFWSFAEGLHTLTAQIKDRSSNGNISVPVSFSFEVVPISGNELNYPFENGDALFSIDFESDHYLYDTSVQLGNLRLRTLYESDGSNDFSQELLLLGLISDDSVYEVGDPRLNPGNEPFPSEIASNVSNLLQLMILQETRKLFDLNELTGVPNTIDLPNRIRFDKNVSPTNQSISRISVGGDNGAEISGGFGVVKSTERSIYNTANRLPFVIMNQRTARVDEGYGVFSTQLIRKYANDPNGFNEWNSRFGPVSYFAYTNTSGKTGLPIGYFPEDANVYLLDPAQISSIPVEYHRIRYSQMRLALQSYAKIIAVSVARVAAKAVGLVADGFPPNGLYGGSQNLPEYFLSEGSGSHFLDIKDENNLLRANIDLNSIFQNLPGPLGFSNFAKIYLRNSIKVTN